MPAGCIARSAHTPEQVQDPTGALFGGLSDRDASAGPLRGESPNDTVRSLEAFASRILLLTDHPLLSPRGPTFIIRKAAGSNLIQLVVLLEGVAKRNQKASSKDAARSA